MFTKYTLFANFLHFCIYLNKYLSCLCETKIPFSLHYKPLLFLVLKSWNIFYHFLEFLYFLYYILLQFAICHRHTVSRIFLMFLKWFRNVECNRRRYIEHIFRIMESNLHVNYVQIQELAVNFVKLQTSLSEDHSKG